jgi:tetratricopeptide (TPR) repeat protein
VGCEEISISNYTKLCNIDSKHSFALNNLGVIAQEAGLNVKAVENYGRSLLQENSLAMANQGYLLLEAGFVEEASSIAQRALLLTEPHKSVHTLIAAIDEKKEKQNEDWLKLCEDAFERQKTIREYVEQYYLGSFEGLDQKWETEQGEEVLLDVGSEEITAAWQENGYGFDNGTFEVKISGTIHGATFKGKYQRKVSNTGLRTVLTTAGEHDKECLGFLTKKANEINIISSTLEDGLFIRLKNGC